MSNYENLYADPGPPPPAWTPPQTLEAPQKTSSAPIQIHMQPNQKETSAMSLTMRIIIGVVVVLVCLVIYIYFAFHVTFNGQSRNGLQLWWFLCTNDEQNEIHSCSLIRPTKTADGRPMTKVPWTYFK